jgi:hypothetical protein
LNDAILEKETELKLKKRKKFKKANGLVKKGLITIIARPGDFADSIRGYLMTGKMHVVVVAPFFQSGFGGVDGVVR